MFPPPFDNNSGSALAEVLEDLVEGLSHPATIVTGRCRLRRWLGYGRRRLLGRRPVVTASITVVTTTPAPVTIAATRAAATTVAITRASAAPVTIATTRAGRLGVGQRGPFEGVDQLEADFAPIDLTHSDLELLTVGQIVLDPLDPCRAVET